MSDIVIKAENLGKMYTIGHQADARRYVALRDVMAQKARTLWHKTKNLATGKAIIPGDTMEDIWALKDVGFEVRRGEAVGIIGRNGAGKSTLLKILSRITEPSTGRVTIRGRIASLLEVGTGFHPELSGRENIYLNGTILGMTRAEIKEKFDEIVAFAEVEKFIDTPVKRYSSGMYVRLAFAVAAHLEPEILVVDEVLAVGDAQFQKKCLGKMNEVAQVGRTVLFVSHNMAAIQALCTKCITLEAGRVIADSDVLSAIRMYMHRSGDFTKSHSAALKKNSHITKMILTDHRGDYAESVQSGDRVCFHVMCHVDDLSVGYHVAVDVYNGSGNRVFYCNSLMVTGTSFKLSSADVVFKCSIPRLPLMPDAYYVHVSLSRKNDRLDFITNAFRFEVVEGDFWKSGRFFSGVNPPLVLVDHDWSVEDR